MTAILGGQVLSFVIQMILLDVSRKSQVELFSSLNEISCFVLGNARAKRMYFVVFYGSTADFAWVADAAVIPYKGVEAFTQYAQDVVDKVFISNIFDINSWTRWWNYLGSDEVTKGAINRKIST